MLERAAACLKSGAVRETLKCAQRSPRSTRMLHSSFWTHGAGDLDLPPWAISAPPNLRNDPPSTNRRESSWAMCGSMGGAPEGVFLDFLYPPQALAWLHRKSGQQLQRWEKRNIRRLPEGFVVASRGYASRVARHRAKVGIERVRQERELRKTGEGVEQSDKSDKKKSRRFVAEEVDPEEESEWNPQVKDEEVEYPDYDPMLLELDQEALEAKARRKEARRGRFRQQNPPDPEPEAEAEAEVASEIKSIEQEPLLDIEFADSPGELADSGQEVATRLRNMMAITRDGSKDGGLQRSEELTENAWTLYESLDEEDRRDARLNCEFAIWLGRQHNRLANIRCMQLYDIIPKDERTLPVYQSVLSALLSQKRPDRKFAVKLHKDALDSVENGYEISWRLAKYAIENGFWALAERVGSQHRLKYGQGESNSQIRVFWLHVSEIPQLLPKAVLLANYIGARKHRYKSPEARGFAAELFMQAISQQFLRPDGSSKPIDWHVRGGARKRGIASLFKLIAEVRKDAEDFMKNFLTTMVAPESSPVTYSQYHITFLTVYRKYSAIAGVKPSQEFFMQWLKKLTWYSDRRQKFMTGRRDNSHAFIINQWRRFYDQPTLDAVHLLVGYYAKVGQTATYDKWWHYMQKLYPNFEDQKAVLWTRIYIHNRRVNLAAAQQAFAEVRRMAWEHNDEPDRRCWNSLLYAHSRADDLDGGLTNLQHMLKSSVKPDQYSFHAITSMLARRGDVEGIEFLLKQYDEIVGEPRFSHHIGSLLAAHARNDDSDLVEEVLREAIARRRAGELPGSLKSCFNVVLNMYAYKRDVEATMRTARWMKDEGLKLNGDSYASIMQVLAFFRQTDAAYKILRVVMPEEGVPATSLHYAIVIHGYVRGGRYAKALNAHTWMRVNKLKSTVSTQLGYLAAKAKLERQTNIRREGWLQGGAKPLEDAMRHLENLLKENKNVASKDRLIGAGSYGLRHVTPAAYFDLLILMHGLQRSFDVVENLIRRYRKRAKKQTDGFDETPIKMLSTLAATHWRAGEHEEVEKCWRLAKQYADESAMRVHVPLLKGPASEGVEDGDALDLQPVELPDGMQESAVYQHTSPQDEGSESNQTLILDKQPIRPREPASGRRYILTTILRIYILSLKSQDRLPDAIKIVSQHLRQGYGISNKTWNTFIQQLCSSSPPLVLLAFVLTERFLSPSFTEWARRTRWGARPQAVMEGLQYIRARYLQPGRLIPMYRTVVMLGATLLQLRRMEIIGRRGLDYEIKPELERYVGTMRQIRQRAPRTLHIVQTMPEIADRMQARILRGEGRET